jgi:hypothetical protein
MPPLLLPLLSAQGDLSAVPQAFHDGRHKDVLAVVDLTRNSYGPRKHAMPARVPHPGGYRVLELTAGLVVIAIAHIPDLRDWGM